MKTSKVYLVYLFLFLLPLISAQVNLGYPIKHGQDITLIQVCDNCSYVNVTDLKYPNSSLIFINSPMIANRNTYSFLLNASLVLDNGIYSYTTCGDLNAQLTCQTVDFEVSMMGTPLDLPKSVFYVVIFLFSIGTFFALIYAGIKLPYSNSRDAMTGYIFAVNNMKYLKIFLFWLAYVALIVILYFGYVISYAFLDMNFLGNIFYFLFIGSVALVLPLFVIGTFMLIANWIRDNQVADALMHGIRIK